MPLHALAIARPEPPAPPANGYLFDDALPRDSRAFLARILDDLIRLAYLPKISSCCCFCAELVAGLLRRNGVAAETVPCRVTIYVPEGIACLGPGFAQQGQIDSHFAVATETMLVDWAMGAARRVKALRPLPLGLALPRQGGPFERTETTIGQTHRLIWEPVALDATATRLHMAEKLKAARILNQANLKRGRPPRP